MIRFNLDLPLNKKTIRKNRFPENTSRLLVEVDDQENVEECLAEFVYKCRMSSRTIIGQSIVTFMKPNDAKRILKEKGLSFNFDSDICPGISRAGDVIVACKSKEDVEFVLRSIEAEALIFYGAEGIRNNSLMQRKLIEAGKEGYIESNFLVCSDVAPLFVFYSSTHPSIEIFGNHNAVKSVFLGFCTNDMLSM